MKKLIKFFFCLVPLVSIGQGYQYEAEINPVETQGYYKVLLSPELLGKLKSDFSDLRIYDENGKEQPYFLNTEQRSSSDAVFHPYKVIERISEPDSLSYIVFENPQKKQIDNVSIRVSNTDVRKRAKLSGSDDGDKWYVIKDNYLLHSMQNNSETSELKIIGFPLSDYAFFKLEFDDRNQLPIQVLNLGYYDTQKRKGFIQSFDCEYTVKDSAKTSYVHIQFPERVYLDQLKFRLSGAEFYARNASFKTSYLRKNRKGNETVHFRQFAQQVLNSNSENEVQFDGFSADELFVEIQNRDDQPLHIDDIEAATLNHYLITELKPNQKFVFAFGDDQARPANYDLKGFRSQLNIRPDIATHMDIYAIQDAEEKVSSDKLPPFVLWTVLGLVGLVLVFFTYRMVAEMGQREEAE